MPYGAGSALLRPRPRRSGAMILTSGRASASFGQALWDAVTPWTARMVGAAGSSGPQRAVCRVPPRTWTSVVRYVELPAGLLLAVLLAAWFTGLSLPG